MGNLFETPTPFNPPLVLREEQRAAIDAVFAAWAAGDDHLLIEMATATGKALVIAELVLEVHRRWPDLFILVLADTVEILKQDIEHLERQAPEVAAAIGVNAASLGYRDWTQQIVFAQVQSVHRSARKLGKRHLVIVDEAHRIPVHQYSMYRKTFAAVEAGEVCGVTATAFRLDSGRLTDGRNALFKHVVFTFNYAQALQAERVIPIISKRAANAVDTSNVRIRRGDFVECDLEAAAIEGDLVERACAEMIRRCEGRYTVLVFAVGVRHGEMIVDTLHRFNETATLVTGETAPQVRADLIESFKRGDIRFLVNVNVLTTGSNIPPIDAIAVLRPTMSTGLWIQIVGRGTRLSPGKSDCLLLDFGGNIHRHGPIDMASINFDPSRLKDCPECAAVTPSSAEACRACGYVWPKQPAGARAGRGLTHGTEPDDAPPQITRWTPEWWPVTRYDARKHFKYNEPHKPPSLRVDYLSGLRVVTEWICIEHQGYPRQKAADWWLAMGGMRPVPATVAEALQRFHEIDEVIAVLPVPEGKYMRISARRLADGTMVGRDCHRWTPPKEPTPLNDSLEF